MYLYEKIIATLLNYLPLNIMTHKFLQYGEPRKLQVISFSKPAWYLKARAFEADLLRAYVHVLARKKLFHMVYILLSDFIVRL